jgi:hypothetical protein
LQAGKVSAAAVRDSTTITEVTSPFPVVQAPPVQDLNYYFSISNSITRKSQTHMPVLFRCSLAPGVRRGNAHTDDPARSAALRHLD